ncbi:MAG TPA: Hsp20/alpha crystallin family protein [Anaerolineaceae bacterium]|nr:Hsp20/alpha crystallin family protein [Anaerolineaceae bacterium]
MITVSLRQHPKRTGQQQEDPSFYIAGVISSRMPTRPHVWRPPTDVYELEDRIIVLVEVAGMSDQGFSITIDRKMLFISGQRSEMVTERKAFHQMEIRFGEFGTDIELSVPVDLEGVVAEYRNGFLWVTLPKSKPKQIQITNESQGDA